MGRFDHLKSTQKKAPRSVEEFIEGANREPIKKRAKKRISKDKILLSITGRSPSREDSKQVLLYVRNDVQEDIEKYCVGTYQAILNYLLRRGLDDLMATGELVMEDLK